MRLFDSVKRFYDSIRVKKLPAIDTIETDVIPIRYKGKLDQRLAEAIRDDIKRYIDFYSVFLEKYDAICIGDVADDNENVLRIENEIEKSIWKYAQGPELSRHARYYLIRDILAGYGERIGSLTANDIVENLKHDRPNHIDDIPFYWHLMNNTEWSNYSWDLCQMKDWKGLRIFLESRNDQDFARQYIWENTYMVLNKAIEMHNDSSENNFFERCIDIISDARKYTEEYREQYSHDVAEGVFYAMERGFDGEDYDLLKKLIAEYESERQSKIVYPKISRGRVLELVKEILDYIDSTGDLSRCFDKKMQEGRIVIFNKDEKDSAFKQFEAVLESKEHADEAIKKEACFLPEFDVVCLPVKDSVVDIPVIIHEFIHQYHHGVEEDRGYSTEVPTVFFEKVAIDYLISHGFEEEKDLLMGVFVERKINDAGNNAGLTNKYITATKIKHDDGEVTADNFMPEAEAAWKKLLEIGINPDKIKREFAIRLINAFSGRKREENENIRKACSYSLGTYFAGEYSGDESMRKRMLELVKNPEYSLQNLIDDFNAERQGIEIPSQAVASQATESNER